MSNNNNFQLKIDPTVEAGHYSNAVSVHISQNEVTLDFGYVLPNQNPVTIKLVSRISLTHASAENVVNVLTNALLDWRNKNKDNKKN